LNQPWASKALKKLNSKKTNKRPWFWKPPRRSRAWWIKSEFSNLRTTPPSSSNKLLIFQNLPRASRNRSVNFNKSFLRVSKPTFMSSRALVKRNGNRPWRNLNYRTNMTLKLSQTSKLI
jgi:hypothetical protein